MGPVVGFLELAFMEQDKTFLFSCLAFQIQGRANIIGLDISGRNLKKGPSRDV